MGIFECTKTFNFFCLFFTKKYIWIVMQSCIIFGILFWPLKLGSTMRGTFDINHSLESLKSAKDSSITSSQVIQIAFIFTHSDFHFVCLVILSLTTECNLMNFFRHNWYLYCTKNYGNQATTTTKWRCHIWRCHIQKLAHNAKNKRSPLQKLVSWSIRRRSGWVFWLSVVDR